MGLDPNEAGCGVRSGSSIQDGGAESEAGVAGGEADPGLFEGDGRGRHHLQEGNEAERRGSRIPGGSGDGNAGDSGGREVCTRRRTVHSGSNGDVWRRHHCVGVHKAGIHHDVHGRGGAHGLCAGHGYRRGGVIVGGDVGGEEGSEDDLGRQCGGHQHHYDASVRVEVKASEVPGREADGAH